MLTKRADRWRLENVIRGKSLVNRTDRSSDGCLLESKRIEDNSMYLRFGARVKFVVTCCIKYSRL